MKWEVKYVDVSKLLIWYIISRLVFEKKWSGVVNSLLFIKYVYNENFFIVVVFKKESVISYYGFLI